MSDGSVTRGSGLALRLAAAFALFALGTALVFGGAMGHDFVWDSVAYLIVAPPVVELSPSYIAWSFTTLEMSNWHPLTWISWGVDTALYGGLEPRGFHLTNLVLHWLVSCLVLVLFLELHRTVAGEPGDGTAERSRTGFFVAALVATLAWSVHPQRVEVVVWVAQRKDLLCALFLLGATIAYVRARRAGARSWYALSVGAYALAVLSKPMAVILPPVLVLLECWPLVRGRSVSLRAIVLATAPFWLLAFGLAWLTVLAQQDTIEGSSAMVDLGTRAVHAFAQVVIYLQKTLLPLRLSPFYPLPEPYVIDSQAISAAIALVAVTLGLLLLALRQGRRGPLLAWAAYGICLVPVIGIVKVGLQAGADRYTYLPVLPLFLAGAFGLARLATTRARVASLGALGLAVAIGYGALARDYTTHWKTETGLWEHAALAYPESHVILFSRAAAYFDAGDYPRAAAAFAAADDIDGFRKQPNHLVHYAYARMHLRDHEHALELLHGARAWGFLPSCTEYNIAWNLAQLARDDEAIAALDRLDAGDAAPAVSALSGSLRRVIGSGAKATTRLAVPYCNDRVVRYEPTGVRLGG